MSEQLTGDAEKLRQRMSSICRAAYGEDWVEHLEYALWHGLVNGPMTYGRTELTRKVLTELRSLSDACAGWICMDSQGIARCLPLYQWQDQYCAKLDRVQMTKPVPPPSELTDLFQDGS